MNSMKTCPHCKGHKIIVFDSDNDWCEKCRKYFPALAEEKCAAGCKAFTGGEIKHHRDCIYYPESFSKLCDDLKKKYDGLISDISAIVVEIQEEIIKRPKLPHVGKIGCMNKLLDILNNNDEKRNFVPEATVKELQDIILSYRKALQDMHFAYINKDGENPHQFEEDALKLYKTLFPKEKNE